MNRSQPSALRSFATVLVILCCLSGILRAQSENRLLKESGGRTFVVAFPDTTTNTFDVRYPNRRYEDKCFLLIYSAIDNTVQISGANASTVSRNVAAGKFLIVDLMDTSMHVRNPIALESCKPTRLGVFRIEASSPVVVYQYMVTRFGTEAWAAIPVEAWGLEHYAAAVPGEVGSDIFPGMAWNYNRKNKAFPSEITVIAAYDDTRINIIPNGTVVGCNQLNVTLQAGEAFQLQSWVDTLTADQGMPQPDFGGSRIYSDKPVGVISGNTRAQVREEVVGLGKNIYKNMLIEWVPPVDQSGTEFVYMPTWDSRRPTGAGGEDLSEKRTMEAVRIYGVQSEATAGYYVDASGRHVFSGLQQGRFVENRRSPVQAIVYVTDRPAQAMMHSSAVIKYAGTTSGWGGYIGAAYDGWGPYMVSLTPREHWTDFAPFYAVGYPTGLEHHINVVTQASHAQDIYLRSGERFDFNRGRIGETDLVWGTMNVAPDSNNWLEGRNGARFYGFVYGTLTNGGHEEYRPGRVRSDPPADDSAAGVSSMGGGGDAIMKESDYSAFYAAYEENLGISYGYPLAPAIVSSVAPDSMSINSTNSCGATRYDVSIVNQQPAGLRNVFLVNPVNAVITSQTPSPLAGATSATVVVSAADRRLDASATLVISDRTGSSRSVPFAYLADRLSISPDTLEFLHLLPGRPVVSQATVRNRTERSVRIDTIELARAGSFFRLVSPPALPTTLAVGDSLILQVEAAPIAAARIFDTLRLVARCVTFTAPIRGQTVVPCVTVGDLRFTAYTGSVASSDLRICNDGDGEVRFVNSAGGPLVEWSDPHFSIPDSSLSRLGATILGMDECTTVPVYFYSDVTGVFQTQARVYADTRNCRDTSRWLAQVISLGVNEKSTGASGISLEGPHPNPSSGASTVVLRVPARCSAEVTFYDASGRSMGKLAGGEYEPGAHRIEIPVSGLASGIYYLHVAAAGCEMTRAVVVAR